MPKDGDLGEGSSQRSLGLGTGFILGNGSVRGGGLQVAVMPDLLEGEDIEASFPAVANDAVLGAMGMASSSLDACGSSGLDEDLIDGQPFHAFSETRHEERIVGGVGADAQPSLEGLAAVQQSDIVGLDYGIHGQRVLLGLADSRPVWTFWTVKVASSLARSPKV